MNEVEIYFKFKTDQEHAIEIFNSLLQTQIQPKKKEVTWPYWCWNCKLKIESPDKATAARGRDGELECPSCGSIIPEP